MAYYNVIKEQLEKIFNEHQELFKIKQDVLDFLKDCPEDNWLENVAPIWNKRSKTLEIKWNFGNDNYFANILWGVDKLQWSVAYGSKRLV